MITYLNDCKTPNLGERMGCDIGMDCGNILLGGCRLLRRKEKYKYIIQMLNFFCY